MQHKSRYNRDIGNKPKRRLHMFKKIRRHTIKETDIIPLIRNTITLKKSMTNALRWGENTKIEVVRISDECIILKKYKIQCVNCGSLDVDFSPEISGFGLYYCKSCFDAMDFEDE